MNRYVVINPFKDGTDNGYLYNTGKPYPRDDVNVDDIDKERIQELLTDKNKAGYPLIKQVDEEQKIVYEEAKPEDLEEDSEDAKPEDLEEDSEKAKSENSEINTKKNSKNSKK